MSRLLPALALLFAAGIGAADGGLWGTEPALQLGFASLLIGCFAPGCRRVAAMGVSFAAGGVALAVPLALAQETTLQQAAQIVLEGRVCARGASLEYAELDLCDSRSPAIAGFESVPIPKRVRLSAFRGRAGFDWIRGLEMGSWVRVRARIAPIASARNPGASSRRERLARQGVGAKAHPVEPLLAVVIGPATSSPRDRVLAAIDRWRERLSERLQARGRGGALVAALVLGDRSAIAESRLDAFRALGVSHLLAISGLHVMWVGGVAYLLALIGARCFPAFLRRRDSRRAAAFVALLAAGLYVVVGGRAIPLVRAFVLLLALVGGAWHRRRIPPSHALAAAALVILCFEPEALFELGAQLSFAATGALLLGRRFVAAQESETISAGRIRNALRDSLRVTATAVAATTPILAFHGLGTTAVGLASNLLLVPWFGVVVLPLSLSAAALATLPGTEDVVVLLCNAVEASTVGLGVLGEWVASFMIEQPAKTGAQFLALAIGWGSLLSRRTTGRVCGALGAVATLAVFPVSAEPESLPRVVVLDVGQGDAILIQGRRGAILVDGGWGLPGAGDRGRSVVVPALRSLGVSRLDLVVATHADADHRGGLPAVLESVPVGTLWLPPGGIDDEAFGSVLAVARRRAVAVEERATGDPLSRFGDLELQTLWPPRGVAFESRNDGSLVTRVGVSGWELLLPGDLGAEAEARLVALPASLRAHVLVAPHHGSRSSSSPEFIAAVNADIAVISAPCRAGARLPSREALSRIRASGTSTWWTGRDGAVEIRLHSLPTAWGWAVPDEETPCRWPGA